jgi:hypothetical protein
MGAVFSKLCPGESDAELSVCNGLDFDCSHIEISLIQIRTENIEHEGSSTQ